MAQARDEAGNVWEVDAQGNPVRLVHAAGQAGPQMPADPTFNYQGPKAAAEVDNTRANARVNTVQANVAEATAPAVIAKTDAEAAKAAAEAAAISNQQSSGRPQLSPEAYAQAMQGYQAAVSLQGVIADLKKKFAAGPGATTGVRGLKDFMGGPANNDFDKAANAARGTVGSALGFTGGQLNSATEAQMNVGPYIPQANDWDSNIQSSIERLTELQQDAFKKSVAIIGGVPDANGRVAPLPDGVPLNAMTIPRIIAGEPLAAAGVGATTQAVPYPAEGQAEHQALIAQLMQQGGGRIDPQAYAQARAALDAKYGAGDPNPAAYAAWAESMNDYLGKGGTTIPSGIEPGQQAMTGLEQARNDLVSNPVGAGVLGAADMGGFGIVSALAPEQMQASSEAHPVASTLGQIGGAIGGTSALGKGAGYLAGKVAPQLLGGGVKSALARGVGTDAAYSALYGNNTGQDPLESALWGAGGSLLGTGVGKGLGAAVGGVAGSAPVRALRARGIPLTAGQAIGGFAKSMEDKATSLPFVGDMINARRLDGLRAFNQQAFNDAGAPIGAKVNEIGQQGTEALFDQAGDAYDNATTGVRVPLDGQYMDDFAGVAALGQQLPDDLRSKFALALNNRINPINDAGELSGESYQQAQRGLKSYKAENVKPGFEQDYRGALSAAQDALRGQMTRSGGQSVVDGLGKADTAYRSIKTIEDAVGRAKGGSGSSETFTFTPSQLQMAIAKTQGKFPGAHPLEALANDGQAVLPSRVPDSGTAGRVAQIALPSGLVGAGGGVGAYANEDDRLGGATTGATTGALLSAMLIAGGTKGGQKALTKLLLDRPELLKKTGSAIDRKKGLFGRATLPFTQPGN